MDFGNVLIHDNSGSNRAPAIVLAILMRSFNWNLEKALWVLRAKHPNADPCRKYIDELFAYELKLLGRNSLESAA